MANAKPIPIPLMKRWHCFRCGLLPPVSFGFCVALTLWLWHCQAEMPETPGEVVRLDVAAAADGVLVAPPRGPWAVSDVVGKGEMIAQLDDRPTRDAIRAVRLEINQLKEELGDAEEVETPDPTGGPPEERRDAARLAWELERRRLDALDHWVCIENDRVQARFHQRRIDYLKPLVKTSNIPANDLDEQMVLRDQVIRRIRENRKALENARTEVNATQARLAAIGSRHAEVFRRFAPLHARIAAQESTLDAAARRIAALEIRAPIGGIINQVYCWPGQHVHAGDAIVAIAAGSDGRVVAHAPRQPTVPSTPGRAMAARLDAPRRSGELPFGGWLPLSTMPEDSTNNPHELIDATLWRWENKGKG
ncbi:MAG: hypothetical protein JW809_05210 [Pirellulales bacterium]|nr:hypothetical protein [Pirellulales bacterium]